MLINHYHCNVTVKQKTCRLVGRRAHPVAHGTPPHQIFTYVCNALLTDAGCMTDTKNLRYPMNLGAMEFACGVAYAQQLAQLFQE
jgi:hypothetical protein